MGFFSFRKRRQRKIEALRAAALAEKYSRTFTLKHINGQPRLVTHAPQVRDVPLDEQEKWANRDEQRNQHIFELGLIPDESTSEEIDQQAELAHREHWINVHELPLTQHATYIREEALGSGITVIEDDDGSMDQEITERIEREGGASGLVQISLAWDDYNDLDLHVFTPDGERIYFNNKRSKCGGLLDVDMNVRPTSNTPVENVVWKDDAPLGTYKVGVHFYKHHRKSKTGKTCQFRLRVITHGKSTEYIGKIKSGQAMQMVTSFTLHAHHTS
jgi:hypothetical protein